MHYYVWCKRHIILKATHTCTCVHAYPPTVPGKLGSVAAVCLFLLHVPYPGWPIVLHTASWMCHGKAVLLHWNAFAANRL